MASVNNNLNNELRQDIQAALQAFKSSPLHDASIALLNTLGYSSDKTIEIPDAILRMTDRVLNPAAHWGEPALYDAEVRKALTLINQLEKCIKP